MSFIETLKNLLKNNKISVDEDEEVKDVTSKTETASNKNSNEYKSFIDDVKAYKSEQNRLLNIPDVKYEEKVYNPVTDEELKEAAENQLYSSYVDRVETLNENKNAKIDGYKNKEKEVKNDAVTQKNNIESYYDNAVEKVSNDAIKRGIQRSSIVSEQVSRLSQNEINDLISLDSKLQNELSEISSNILKAETEYQNAVKNLDLKKAVEVSEKVAELKEKEDKKRKEIEEFNLKALEEVNKANEILNKEKATELEKNRKGLLDVILNYFSSLPSEARYQEFINDTELLEILGDDVEYIKKYLK